MRALNERLVHWNRAWQCAGDDTPITLCNQGMLNVPGTLAQGKRVEFVLHNKSAQGSSAAQEGETAAQ